ncbi:MAG: DUF6273 domain-containing protein [Bacilli bacterium]|nr:DUF6273 domain-containing protein [Bacilli bacterium]
MKKIKLLLSSLMLISLLANCNGSKKTYTVIWKNDDGTILETDNNVPYGAMPSYDGNAPSKASTDEYSYVFSGWDHEIAEVTSDQVYVAQYKSTTNTYTIIWQNDDETEIQRNTDVEYGSIPSEFKPANPSKPEDEEGKYSFTGWDKDITQKITGDTTFKAVYDTTHKYSVSVGETDKLKFETLAGEPINTVRVYENEDFVFKMKVNLPSNSIDYIVPSTLSVEVKDVGKLVDGVSIDAKAPYHEATVTIDGSKITNEIIISGSAIQSGSYEYMVSSYYGLKPIADGTVTAGEDKVLTFETIDSSFGLPKAENIYIYFDKVDKWISPAEEGVEEYCSYDETNGKLTIKSIHIRSNINIKARAFGYHLLNDLTWKKINDISQSGEAPYLFYIGEEKTIEVEGEINQNVRIIDFNHDELETSTPEKPLFAGITFEFVNTIVNFSVQWNSKHGNESTNFDFIHDSSLNECLQPHGGAYDKMPSDLLQYVKFVTKHVETSVDEGKNYIDTAYGQKLFPLSVDEINGNDDNTYEYYKIDSKDKRAKDRDYWLRSPNTSNGAKLVWRVDNLGQLNNYSTIDGMHGVAPAFCI